MKTVHPSMKIFFMLFSAFAIISLIIYAFDYIYVNPSSTESSESMIGVDYDSRDELREPSLIATEPGNKDGSSVALTEEDQKIVKTGSISMSVSDFDESVSSLRTIVKSVGGFVSNLYDYGEDSDRTVSVSVKIPSAVFDSVFKKLKALGVDIESSYENTDDVTASYLDLEARLENQIAFEAQLVSILNQAVKVSDILEVQKELSTVRETIEQLEASKRYYDSQIDMSTITVSMTLDTQALDVQGNQWRPVGVFKEALAALVLVLKGFGSIAIWFVVFSPFIIIPKLIIKARRRRK